MIDSNIYSPSDINYSLSFLVIIDTPVFYDDR